MALGITLVQIMVAAAMVLLTLPPFLQAAHAAVGTVVWAALVCVTLSDVARAA